MAVFRFSAKILSRTSGASAVRAAAYRAGERLYDHRLGHPEDYTRKSGVVEAAIFAPEGAPDWVRKRQDLWNNAEAAERRKDSQVAQEILLNLPREFSQEENWRLVTDFAREHLVKHGRIVDAAFHVGTASDGLPQPHAHLLMPVRELGLDDSGEIVFKAKHDDCSWRTFTKRRDRLEELREVWCDLGRQRAVELGIDLGPDWDHRSLADRGIDLEPQPKLGAEAQGLEAVNKATRRAAKIAEIQRDNGERILKRPEIVIEALTVRNSTFTDADLARWVHRNAADDQFNEALAKARSLALPVGRDDSGRERFSSAEMIALEQRMVDSAGELAARNWHGLRHRDRLDQSILSTEQKDAARYLLERGDVACLTGYAGAGKSTLLAEVRQELERSGYRVRGAALSGISAEGLENGSGIGSRTVASLLYAWEAERDELTAQDVLVVDEAGMVGSRDLSKLIDAAQAAKAKLILVGDPEQLQAIDAGAAFRAIAERTGTAQLTEIRRQRAEWQREATRELATDRTGEALARYRAAGDVTGVATDAEARAAVVAAWNAARRDEPDASRIMLAHTRADVRQLNEIAREAMALDGKLGEDQPFETSRGARQFAQGDRLLFLRNERKLEVKNGTLGTVQQIDGKSLIVRTDDGRSITVNASSYNDFDYGYAVTVAKAQGVTVDECYVLATRGFDRHLSYVALSRHRDSLKLVHSLESFSGDSELDLILGRERLKDTSLDYDYQEELPERLAGGEPQKNDAAAILAEARRRRESGNEIEGPERGRGRDRDFGLEL